MQLKQEDPDMVANLSHRVQNLEQENEVLRRYLAAVPLDLEAIMDLDCEEVRAERLNLLRNRVVRITGRIDDFVNEPPVGLHMPPAVRKFAWRLRYMNGTMIFALVSCAFDDNEGPPYELTWPDAQENELQPFISPVSEAVLLQGVSLMCRRCY